MAQIVESHVRETDRSGGLLKPLAYTIWAKWPTIILAEYQIQAVHLVGYFILDSAELFKVNSVGFFTDSIVLSCQLMIIYFPVKYVLK